MQIDQLQVKLRVRNSWEAIDLGTRMLQHWAWPIYRAWFAVTLPIFVVLNLLCLIPWPGLSISFASLLFWWLLPLFDRSLLQVLSQALFGQIPPVKSTAQQSLSLWKKQAFIALTWRRFMPARSFYLPVAQLEGLSGQARKTRITALAYRSNDASNAVWLTLFCVNLIFALLFALYALLEMLVPQGVNFSVLDWVIDETPSVFSEFINNLFYYLAITVVEPLYVAAGFSLYLNRRSQLESWDIELAFRQARQSSSAHGVEVDEQVDPKLSEPKPETAAPTQAPAEASGEVEPSDTAANKLRSSNILGAWLLGLCCLGLMYSQASYAAPDDSENKGELEQQVSKYCERFAENQQRHINSQHPVENYLGELLNDEKYQPCEEKEVWVRKDLANIEQASDSGNGLWLNELGSAFAQLMRMLLWALAALAVLLVVYFLLERRPQGKLLTPTAKAKKLEAVFAQLSLDTSQLPADLLDEAQAALSAGDPRQCLSLLYRGALRSLMEQQNIDLGKSQTEGECLRAALPQLRENTPEQANYFQQLTDAWQQIAYSLLPLETAYLEQLMQTWPRYFQPGPSA